MQFSLAEKNFNCYLKGLVMDLERLNMEFWEPDFDTDADFLTNNFLLEIFVSYFWPRYNLQPEEDQRRLIEWLLSPNNGKGSRHEQNLKLDLEPALAFLSKSNDDPTYTDENGQTILHLLFAIYLQNEYPRDDHQITTSLMNAGASIIAADRNGNTPLGMAIAKNRLDIVQSLPSHLKNINERNSLGETALHIVMKSYVKQNNNRVDSKDKWTYEKIIKSFITRGANFSIADVNGITPVHYAATKCYLSILKMLKDCKANLHSKTKNGDNLLICACKNITIVDNDSIILPTIEWLLGQGYDVNYRNQGGHTALHYAVQSGHNDVVAQLIERGADVNVVGLDGTTPLHSAIMSSKLKSTNSFVVAYLLKQGIKADSEEKVFGFGIEHLAALNRGKTIVFRKKYVNKQSNSGLTPLHLAAMSANTDVVKDLIELGADVHCREKTYGYTPLHLASMRGQFRSLDDISLPALEEQLDMNQPNLIKHCFDRLNFRTNAQIDYQPVIDLLLKAGADVNAKDTLGRTPLHCAMQQSESKVVEKLLKAGAHVDAVDNESRTPLQNAILAVTDNWQGIECLLKYGADIDDIEASIKDIYDQSKIYKFTIADRLLRYVAKQECVDLRSENFYKPQHKKPRIDNFKPKYMKEIQFMKKRMIKDNVSLYEMLYMTSKQRASLVDILPSDIELQVSFLDYGAIIRGRCYEAVNRESMLEPAKSACNLMMRVQWPDLCIEYIFSFLRNRDLRALIDSAWE